MTGRVEQTLPALTGLSGPLRRHPNPPSPGPAARRARVDGRDSWMRRMAVALAAAFMMLLAGFALWFAVATVVGYQWPGLWSPALPMPLTPEPGLGL